VVVRAARDARAALTVLAILAVVVGAPLLYLGWRELDGQRSAGQAALQADWLLIPGYVLAGVGVFGLGALFLYGSGVRRVARWCAGGVLLVAAADVAERPGDTLSEVATPLAVLKFAVGGPLLPVFVVIGSVLLGRRLSGPSRVRRREDAEEPEIARAGELDPGTDRRPDIILPPAATPAPTCPARPRPAGATPAASRRGGRPRRSASAPRAAGSARPRSPLGRSRRSSATSCRVPATWCRCPAAGT
jgi:hypothetical protein